MNNKPAWLKVRAPSGSVYENLKAMVKDLNLSTVCQEALCPNIQECWEKKTATFMLMGDTCTRACKFCAVKTGNPKGILDREEPQKIAQAIASLGLDYAVLTSVDRDDLDDLGSGHFAKTVEELRRSNPEIIVEVLTPDFNAIADFIDKVLKAKPHVFAHNLETTKSLTPYVRDPRSQYKRSLKTLEIAKSHSNYIYTKSSIMLGLGEEKKEVIETLKDLRAVDCDIVTFGQYLAPTNRHKKYLPVRQYIAPDIFKQYQDLAYQMGFLYVASGPLVRSSYRAGEFFMKAMIKKRNLKSYPTLENHDH